MNQQSIPYKILGTKYYELDKPNAPEEQAEKAEKVRPESKPESRHESMEGAVLDLLKKIPLSKSKIS